MEVWLILVIVGSALLVSFVTCYWIAYRQRREKTQSMRHLSHQRLLDGEMICLLPDELPYTIFHNHFMGSWLQLVDGYGKLNSFNVYSVHLNHIDSAFRGKRQEWSKTYKAAIQIYGPGNAAKALRTAIRSEHSALYRKTGIERTTTGLLRSTSDFLDLIENGVSRGERMFFTYVLTEEGDWRFSHTGVGKLRDNLSKHAVHSNAAESVVYAGEFHYDLVREELVVDNSSGTFAPAETDLASMVKVLQDNFPGLRVRGLHWASQDLADAIDQAPTRSLAKKQKSSGGGGGGGTPSAVSIGIIDSGFGHGVAGPDKVDNTDGGTHSSLSNTTPANPSLAWGTAEADNAPVIVGRGTGSDRAPPVPPFSAEVSTAGSEPVIVSAGKMSFKNHPHSPISSMPAMLKQFDSMPE